MYFNKQLKLMLIGFFCMMVIFFIGLFLYLDQEEKAMPLKKENALQQIEEKEKNNPDTVLEKNNDNFYQETLTGMGEEKEGVNMKVYTEEEQKMADANSEGMKFNPTESAIALTSEDVVTFENRLLQYFYAENFQDGQALVNKIFLEYDLNTINDPHFKRLLGDLNLVFQQYVYGSHTVSINQLSTPELVAFLFLKADFETQLDMIYEKNSLVVSSGNNPEILSIQEVSPTAHDADRYFLNVGKGKCYEILSKCDLGEFYVYIYETPEGMLKVLSIKNKSAELYTTYKMLIEHYDGLYD